MSWELRTELYFVFSGLFSTMKKGRFPSAEIVGRSSARLVLMFGPRFSILMMVDALITFSFCAFSVPMVSIESWALDGCHAAKRKEYRNIFFKGSDFVR